MHNPIVTLSADGKTVRLYNVATNEWTTFEAKVCDSTKDMRSVAASLSYNETKKEGCAKHLLLVAASRIDKLEAEATVLKNATKMNELDPAAWAQWSEKSGAQPVVFANEINPQPGAGSNGSLPATRILNPHGPPPVDLHTFVGGCFPQPAAPVSAPAHNGTPGNALIGGGEIHVGHQPTNPADDALADPTAQALSEARKEIADLKERRNAWAGCAGTAIAERDLARADLAVAKNDLAASMACNVGTSDKFKQMETEVTRQREALGYLSRAIGNPCVSSDVSLEMGLVKEVERRINELKNKTIVVKLPEGATFGVFNGLCGMYYHADAIKKAIIAAGGSVE